MAMQEWGEKAVSFGISELSSTKYKEVHKKKKENYIALMYWLSFWKIT